jgi:hydrogenase-4 component E
MMELPYEGILSALFVFVLVTAALIIIRRDIPLLFTDYALQSFFIAVIAFILFLREGSVTLLILCVLTFMTRVLIIPYVVNKIQRLMKIKRDVTFRYLTPVGSMIVSIVLIIIIYYSFFKFARDLTLEGVSYLGAILGISLAFMGMLVIFSRKTAITKIVGYLVMENGVLLFSLFFSELPMIVEILIILDLIMLILIATILAFGIDSTLEQFHEKINVLPKWLKDGDE